MSEAVITRGGIGGGSVGVSNQTKEAYGLDNNATLDDILLTLAYKDPNYATMIVTVQDPDGTIIRNTNVNMVPITGTALEYVTNEKGQTMFKTNVGMVNFQEKNVTIPYVDLEPNSINNFATVIGEIYYINLVRRAKTSSVKINSNSNVIFSNSCGSVDVHCYGAGGGGGGGSHSPNRSTGFNLFVNAYYNPPTVSVYNVYYIYGGKGGNGYYNMKRVTNIIGQTNYQIAIYPGGNGGAATSRKLYDFMLNTNQTSFHSASFSTSLNNIPAGNSGGITKFSDILYASGGNGGSGAWYRYAGDWYGENGNAGDGGNGGSGGSGGSGTYWYTIKNTSQSNYWDMYCSTSAGSRGTSGYVVLNNFKLKS